MGFERSVQAAVVCADIIISELLPMIGAFVVCGIVLALVIILWISITDF